MPPHGAIHFLLDPGLKIAATSKVLFPLLSVRLSILEEALDWMQFTFTGDRTRAYVSPESTFFVCHLMTEG